MRRPARGAIAAILSACTVGMTASTVCSAAYDGADDLASRTAAAPIDTPPSSQVLGSDLKISADDPHDGASTRKVETTAETALVAAYANGLPIPKPFIDKVATNAKFRVEAHATVSASMATVIAFYRRELGKLGWIEDAGLARTEPNKLVLVFHAPEGRAELAVTNVREGTGSDLVLRKTAEAEKSGLLPNKGMATVVVGNAMDEPAAVTINGTTYKLGPGEGTGKPTGPKLNLAAGTYAATTVIGSKPAIEDRFTVGDGEIWGLLLGPNGNLPLQMY